MGALEKEHSVQHTKWNTPKIEKTKLVVDEREVDEFLQTEKKLSKLEKARSKIKTQLHIHK